MILKRKSSGAGSGVSPAEAFAKSAIEGGQDKSVAQCTGGYRFLLCLGCISEPKTGPEIVLQLSDKGCISPLEVSSVYRELRSLEQAGLIMRSGKRYELTEAGRQVRPDVSMFERICEAVKLLSKAKPSPKGQLIILAIQHGPKNGDEVKRHLESEGFSGYLGLSNLHRDLKAIEAKGTIQRNPRTHKYELTDTGKMLCPDEALYARIRGALSFLLEINVSFSGGAGKHRESNGLARKAAASIEKLDGVVSEDVLAPLKALLIDYEKKNAKI